MSTSITETVHRGGFLLSELPGYGSRDLATLVSGQNLKAGTVLGRIIGGTSASAAKTGGNTGNGTFVLDATTPILPGAKHGIYTIRCITAGTNDGTFRLEDPDGNVLGDFTIPTGAGNSVTVSDDIKGVLTDGTTDFAAGDGFDVTITLLGGKVTQLAPTATTGAEAACGILFDNVDATSADHAGAVIIARSAEVRDTALSSAAPALAQGFLGVIQWPSGITSAQKATATAQLLALGISIRKE